MLKDPSKEFTYDEILTAFEGCFDLGAWRAEHARDKEAVIFIGNTGAGKSTTINYLLGCEMESISKKEAGLKGIGRYVRTRVASAHVCSLYLARLTRHFLLVFLLCGAMHN